MPPGIEPGTQGFSVLCSHQLSYGTIAGKPVCNFHNCRPDLFDPQQGSHPVATRSGKHFVSIASAKVNKISEPAKQVGRKIAFLFENPLPPPNTRPARSPRAAARGVAIGGRPHPKRRRIGHPTNLPPRQKRHGTHTAAAGEHRRKRTDTKSRASDFFRMPGSVSIDRRR